MALHLLQVYGNGAAAAIGTDQHGIRSGIVQHPARLFDDLGKVRFAIFQDIFAGIGDASVHLNGTSGREFRDPAHDETVVRLDLEISSHGEVIVVHGEGHQFILYLIGLGDIHPEHFHPVVGSPYFKTSRHGEQVVYGNGRIVRNPHRFFHGTAHAHLADVGIGGIVEDLQAVTRLEVLVLVAVQGNLQILHLGRVGQILAENVCHRIDARLQAAGIFKGLTDGHPVVHVEITGEGPADLAGHGDRCQVTIGFLAQHPDSITLLQGEVRVPVDSREGDGQNLHTVVRAGTLHEYDIRLGRVFRFGLVQQGLQAAVLCQIIPAFVIHVSGDGHIVFNRLVGCLEANHIARLQAHHLAVHHGRKVVFQKFHLAVLLPLNLNKIRIGIVGKAAGIANQIRKGFPFHQLVPHRSVHGSLDAHHLLGHRYKEHITILQVVVHVYLGMHHKLVEVKAVRLTATRHLNITD